MNDLAIATQATRVSGQGPGLLRLRAAGDLRVATDLYLEMLQRGAVAWAEQEVQNLTPLRLGVVDEQPGHEDTRVRVDEET